MTILKSIIKISGTIWEIPISYKTGMRVPSRIYATEKLFNNFDEVVFDQITNVAILPGMRDQTFFIFIV